MPNGLDVCHLSPGEHLIFLLLLWEYIFSSYEIYGLTVLLFDEPDAHLHPSAVKGFLEILKSLARKDIQVIMTTHNPTTASFVEDQHLFLLYEDTRDSQLKIRTGQKNEINRFLCSNLVNVEIPVKTLLVEGDDAKFYKNVCEYLNSRQYFNCPYSFQVNMQSLFQVCITWLIYFRLLDINRAYKLLLNIFLLK